MHYFLGLEIWHRNDEIFLCQGRYTMEIFCRFGMVNCKSMNTLMDSNLRKIHDTVTRSDPVDPTLYRQLIGSSMYLIHSRPDIFYTISILSQFMDDPRHIHQVVGNHILRYLCGTVAYRLRYASNGGVLLLGYTDSDWGGNIVDHKSTSRYCFILGFAMISWSRRKQASIAQSTIEGEYIAASTTCREVVWL